MAVECGRGADEMEWQNTTGLELEAPCTVNFSCQYLDAKFHSKRLLRLEL